MLEALYSIPFSVLEVPNLKIKQPTWLHQPSAMTVFSMVLLSYFLVTGGMLIDCFLFVVFTLNEMFKIFTFRNHL